MRVRFYYYSCASIINFSFILLTNNKFKAIKVDLKELFLKYFYQAQVFNNYKIILTIQKEWKKLPYVVELGIDVIKLIFLLCDIYQNKFFKVF